LLLDEYDLQYTIQHDAIENKPKLVTMYVDSSSICVKLLCAGYIGIVTGIICLVLVGLKWA